MEEKKYELLKEDSISVYSSTLYRIRALKDFGYIKAGDLGGYIEKEDNLSQYDTCWVYNNARVYGNAKVYNNAIVYGNARVHDNAEVYGNAKVYDNAEVYSNARVFGDARVYGDARVFNNAKVYNNAIVYGNARIYGNAYIMSTNDYIVIGPIGSRSDYTTFYLDKDRNIYVKCGCFSGTIEEFENAVKETHK